MIRGEVFFSPEFGFSDGTTKDKFLILMNTPVDSNPFLFVLTTSQKKFRSPTLGCHSKDEYYVIEEKKHFFKWRTWLKFDSLVEMDYIKCVAWHFKGKLIKKAVLNDPLIIDIVNCLKQSPGITGQQISFLN